MTGMNEMVLVTRGELEALLEDAVIKAVSAVAEAWKGGEGAGAEGGIIPLKPYTRQEAADILGFSRVQTLSEISEEELPRRRVGPKGGSVLYLGRDLLRYVLGMPPVHDDPAEYVFAATASPAPASCGSAERSATSTLATRSRDTRSSLRVRTLHEEKAPVRSSKPGRTRII